MYVGPANKGYKLIDGLYKNKTEKDFEVAISIDGVQGTVLIADECVAVGKYVQCFSLTNANMNSIEICFLLQNIGYANSRSTCFSEQSSVNRALSWPDVSERFHFQSGEIGRRHRSTECTCTGNPCIKLSSTNRFQSQFPTSIARRCWPPYGQSSRSQQIQQFKSECEPKLRVECSAT